MVERVLADDYEALSVESLCAAAKISVASFEAAFAGLEDAYIWIHKRDAEGLKAVISAAFDENPEWRDAVRAAGYAGARWVEANPRAMHFGMIEMRGAGEIAQAERETELNWMIDVIDTGRTQLEDPDSKDRSWAIGVMGAIYSKLASEIEKKGPDLRASEYVAECLYLVVLPYLGQAAAEEELGRKEGDLERYRRGEI